MAKALKAIGSEDSVYFLRELWREHTQMSKSKRENSISVSEFLEENLGSSIRRAQELIRHRSVTADREAVLECAEFLRNLLAKVGCKDARLVETEGNPIVYGELPANSPYTLLIYMMYDTQPVDRGEWHFDPFGGEIAETERGDEIMYGRGAMNSKGPLIAFMDAVDAILKVEGKLPVNLKIVADGEEEIGSPSFPQFLKEYEEQLRADACLAVTPNAGNAIFLGFKGIMVLELECNTEKWGKGPLKGNVHSKFKPILDNPVWHLTKALSTLVADDEDTILVDGFNDYEYSPSPSEAGLVNTLSQTVPMTFFTRFGPLPNKLRRSNVRDIIEKLLFKPSMNISSIKSGHSGEQISTIIPHVASCRIDIRFFGRDDEQLLRKMKHHFKIKGYGDITVKKLASLPSYRVNLNEPITQALLKSYHEIGLHPQVWPNSGGGCVVSVIGNRLKIPSIQGGRLSGGGDHGVDEYMLIRLSSEMGRERDWAGLLECEKSYASILHNFPYFASVEK